MKKIFLAILFLLIACNAMAATYYVAQTAQVAAASDDNAGTDPALPWETIAKVEATVTSGDTVYFHSASTWTGATPILTGAAGVKYYGASWGGGTRATFEVSSSSSTLGVVILGANSITFDGFKIDGKHYYTTGIGTGQYINADISGIIINNCEVVDTGEAAEPSTGYWYYGIHISAYPGKTISNVEVTNNILHSIGHEGIALYPQYNASAAGRINGALVRGNEVYNTGVSGERQKLIAIVNNTDNAIVEFNYLHDMTLAGLGIEQYDPDNNGYQNDLVVRYNYLYNTTGINVLSYTGAKGLKGGPFDIYGNISYGGGLTIQTCEYFDSIWRIYNNTIEVDYSAGTPSSYALDFILYNGVAGGSNFEIKNNIFVNKGIYVVRDLSNSLSDMHHNNNLFFRRDSTSNLVTTSVLSDANAITATSVAITHDATYTYFTKSGGTDWSTIFAANQYVEWSGFTNAEFNDRRMRIVTVSADVIKVNNVKGLADGNTETATVTGAKWVGATYNATQTQSTYETTSQVTDPTFAGGDLPTGFSGTYGSNMVPNTTYFSLQAGSPALNNGAVLASPYNKAINNAGTDSTYTRGTAWDIGAYEYTLDGGATIVNTGAVFSGCTF